MYTYVSMYVCVCVCTSFFVCMCVCMFEVSANFLIRLPKEVYGSEHFCGGNTLPLFINLEKSELVFLLLLVPAVCGRIKI